MDRSSYISAQYGCENNHIHHKDRSASPRLSAEYVEHSSKELREPLVQSLRLRFQPDTVMHSPYIPSTKPCPPS